MLSNLKAVLAYDGGRYFGWQKTRDGPSIEEELEKVFSKILGHPIKLQAASRTDRGVHAVGQVINFFSDTKMDLNLLRYSANSLLPNDIQILSLEKTRSDFHPTTDSKHKTYLYSISKKQPLPLMRHTTWHYPYPLNLDLMEKIAGRLIGKRDFKAFTNRCADQREDTICELFSLDITETEIGIEFQLCGDRFLYKMVRNIVGTLCDIGSGKLLPNTSFDNRKSIGQCAPAHGLLLKEILH